MVVNSNYCPNSLISLSVCCRSSIVSVMSWFWSIWTAWRSDSGIPPNPAILTSLHGAGPPAGSLSHPQSPLLTFLPSFCQSNPDPKAEGRRWNKKKCRVELSAFLPQTSKYVHPSVSWLFFRFRIFSAYFPQNCERFQSLAWCGVVGLALLAEIVGRF